MDFLKTLGIQAINAGACSGPDAWLLGSKDNLLQSHTPVDDTLIAKITYASEEDYQTIVKRAQTAAIAWRKVPAPVRGEFIRQVADALREYKDALGSLVAYEMGKPKAEGDGEVQEMIDIADFAVGQSRMLYGYTMHSERPEHRMYEQWHPLGTIGVISAFNFPVAVWAWNAFIAAIAGNTTVWKPSTKTPLCAIAVQHICNQVMQRCGYQSIFSFFIPETVELTEQFVADKRLPLISFTGSTPTGRHVAAIVAKRLGRCLLELGGNNAVIIDETADLKLVIPAVVFGAVGTAGQRCTTIRRLIIHESIYDEVKASLVKAYKQVVVGNPLESGVHMGPLIDSEAAAAYGKAIDEIRAAGGKILCGGKAIKQTGNYVEPTIVQAQADWDIVQRETFAPILYLLSYSTIEQAIAIQNGVSQGLSSALFTNNIRNAELYLSARGSDCGIANINIGTSGAEIGGAFGGEKDTGGGRESGSDAWKAYMRRQTNTINWGAELPLAQGIKFEL